jgi:hypothetical protein
LTNPNGKGGAFYPGTIGGGGGGRPIPGGGGGGGGTTPIVAYAFNICSY